MGAPPSPSSRPSHILPSYLPVATVEEEPIFVRRTKELADQPTERSAHNSHREGDEHAEQLHTSLLAGGTAVDIAVRLIVCVGAGLTGEGSLVSRIGDDDGRSNACATYHESKRGSYSEYTTRARSGHLRSTKQATRPSHDGAMIKVHARDARGVHQGNQAVGISSGNLHPPTAHLPGSLACRASC